MKRTAGSAYTPPTTRLNRPIARKLDVVVQKVSGLCYNTGVMNPRIEINPNVCHGSPVVRGTRVLVSQILGALSGGDSDETVLEDYSSIASEDISAVFDFEGSLARKDHLPTGFSF